jgi:phosphopantothenoylcysteine decarboxylase/phosphopantothenate--cysteine ligase
MKMADLTDKNIVLGVCGGIAAYKTVELTRLLIRGGAAVRVIMTANAHYFIGPTTFEALTGKPVLQSLFDHAEAVSHIQWAQSADAVVLAPATANLIGKLAAGIADDALTTFMLAVTAPVLVCPSMNSHMLASRAVQRNLDALAHDGLAVLAPAQGELACGTTGPGRLPEPAVIVDRIQALLTAKDLNRVRILVTAGPTREFIDPVRYVSNPSTGKMGFAVARAAEHRGAQVTLISGPTALTDPYGVEVVRVTSAQEMAEAVFERMAAAQVIIKTAAVSDYRPKEPLTQKMKKTGADLTLALEPTMDILSELGRRKAGRILVGFAAETHDMAANARAKLAAKNLDLLAANPIGAADAGFAADTNRISLFHADGTMEELPLMAKAEAARVILDRVVKMVKKRF